MPGKTPSQVLEALVTQRYPIPVAVWDDFWDRLESKTLQPGEALAVVTSLTSRLPDGESVSELLSSLRARNPQPAPPAKPTVNIVGTGGGPSTFNLSTASAFVAAAMGARVIKTGSRAYASRTGSVDLLDRLGIRLTSSYEQSEEMLERFGIACAGPFVYPKELALLARSILPFGMKTVGRFFNVIGPFLAAIPVTTQITGASDHSVLPTFRQLVEGDPSKRYWICSNSLGVDELLSIVPSDVYDSGDDKEFTLDPGELGLVPRRSTTCCRSPISTTRSATSSSSSAATARWERSRASASMRLRFAINGGVADEWPAALQLAADVMSSGEPARRIEQLRAHATAGAAAS